MSTRARQQKAMPVGLLLKLRKPPVMLFATGFVYPLRYPHAGNRTVFMRSFTCVHTHQATTADAEPVVSHKNEFCLLIAIPEL